MASNKSSADLSLLRLFADIERDLIGVNRLEDAYDMLSRVAVERVPGAQRAGVTVGKGTSMVSYGVTDDVVKQVDAVQYGLRSGPCVDATLLQRVFRADDLRTETRWPVFSRAAVELGVLSMMSFRLYLPENVGMVAGLNFYSDLAGAFDETAETVGMLLSTLGALTIVGAKERERSSQLSVAVESNREIGMAMGILMHQYTLSREQAFDVLRITSQDTNRKLAVVAAEVVDTGQITLSARLQTKA